MNARYGGVDAILMWPTYTNIGTDARSQFDLFAAMPGGLKGVKQAIDQLHKAGVKVSRSLFVLVLVFFPAGVVPPRFFWLRLLWGQKERTGGEGGGLGGLISRRPFLRAFPAPQRNALTASPHGPRHLC